MVPTRMYYIFCQIIPVLLWSIPAAFSTSENSVGFTFKCFWPILNFMFIIEIFSYEQRKNYRLGRVFFIKCLLFAIFKFNHAFLDNLIPAIPFLQTHLAGYVKEADNLKDHGIGELVCISVNDAFVMGAWARDSQAEGKVGT